MKAVNPKIRRPLALVILDGWGYAPRTEGNAIAIAHTPYYDEICRKYPMTTLAAAGENIGQPDDHPGNAEMGHMNMGTGRRAKTQSVRIKNAIQSGEFSENSVLNRALSKAKTADAAVHVIGMLSDGGVHSSTENLFAILRVAKTHKLENVFVHAILDGVDVPQRTADIYVEALEIKLADIGIGQIATLCGRYFAMDSGENWERTARAFTMLVHGEGERSNDAVTSVRNSFLRGIADEFIAPIILESSTDTPVAKIRNGDLVVFFNHRAETMRQLVRSLCIQEGASGARPIVETVCLTEYDSAYNLPTAFRQESEKNSLSEILSDLAIPIVRITETVRASHLTYFFDGSVDSADFGEHHFLSSQSATETAPESQSFKITDAFRKSLHSSHEAVFVVNIPAADMMAASGDMDKTVAAIQYIDTCLGEICEKVRAVGGAVVITSTHGNCEEMLHLTNREINPLTTKNPVPFHYVDDDAADVRLYDGKSLQDIAPTILGILSVEKPAEMTGSDLRCL